MCQSFDLFDVCVWWKSLTIFGSTGFLGLEFLASRKSIPEALLLQGNSGVDMIAMNEALNAQQKLLHKLYAELDQEREASETAASEALSMIMRLQVEKAAVEMEAKQYKSIAEEKLFHANECVGILEGVVYQKNMEIASLECQIQAYKYKLLSMGFYDIECGETRNESIENSRGDEVNINTLLPLVRPVVKKEKARANSVDWTEDGTLYEESKNIAVDKELKVDVTETSDIGISLWQQIQKLDERVKGISYTNEFGKNTRRNLSGSLCSHRSINVLNPCIDAVKKLPEILQDYETIDDPVSSTRVQDIFEVPEVSVSHIDTAGKQKVEPEEEIARGKIKLLEPASPTTIKSLFKSEPKASFNSSPENKLFKSSSMKNFNIYAFPCTQSAISNAESSSEIKHLGMRIDRLEQSTSGQNSQSEITVIGAEELSSLKESLNEIQTQLNTIQTDIKSLKPLKSKKLDDSAFNRLQEAMLHFWI